MTPQPSSLPSRGRELQDYIQRLHCVQSPGSGPGGGILGSGLDPQGSPLRQGICHLCWSQVSSEAPGPQEKQSGRWGHRFWTCWQGNRTSALTLPLPSSAALSRSVPISVPQFPPLCHGDNHQHPACLRGRPSGSKQMGEER